VQDDPWGNAHREHCKESGGGRQGGAA
jgi:hypothetical protein